MVLFHNYEDLLLKNIIIKNPVVFSEKYRTQAIKYLVNQNQEDLFIQTPYIFIRYGPNSYEGNFDSKIVLDIPFSITKKKKASSQKLEESQKLEQNDHEIQSEELYKLIKKIHKSLKTKLIKKQNQKLSDITDTESKIQKNKEEKREKYIECLKPKEELFKSDTKHYNLKTKIHTLNGKPYLKIYNSNRKLQKEQHLKPHTLTRFIIHLESIWYFEDTYGFNWYVVQAEIKLPSVPVTYKFYNSEALDIEIVLEKFKKMQRQGISPSTIQNKMKLEGVDPLLLYDTLETMGPVVHHIPVPPPPPPPPPPGLNTHINKGVRKLPPTPQEVSPMRARVPTLGQLQEQLQKLKKVKESDKSHNVYKNRR